MKVSPKCFIQLCQMVKELHKEKKERYTSGAQVKGTGKHCVIRAQAKGTG